MTRSLFVVPVLCAQAIFFAGCDNPGGASGSGAGPSSSPRHPAMYAELGKASASMSLPSERPSSSPSTATGSRTGSSDGSTAASGLGGGSGGGDADGKLAARLGSMGLAVTLPTGWVEVASSSRMRLGTVRLPRVEGDTEDGELSIIPAMGTVEANVDRWSGQFQEKPVPVLSTREVGEFEITFVELWGTFSPGMGAGGNSTPKPETLLLGAIVRMPGVSSLLFFKAWGPRKTMDQRKPEFEEFVSSLRPAR